MGNTFNTNSQATLSKKATQNYSKPVNPQFSYTAHHDGNVQVQGKSLTRNMQNESHEPGNTLNRENFNGDTGHDYNMQQQEEQSRRQNAMAMVTGQSIGGSQSKSRGRQNNTQGLKSNVVAPNQHYPRDNS